MRNDRFEILVHAIGDNVYAQLISGLGKIDQQGRERCREMLQVVLVYAISNVIHRVRYPVFIATVPRHPGVSRALGAAPWHGIWHRCAARMANIT